MPPLYTHWPRAPQATTSTKAGGAVSPSDLINEAEEHWNVSGSSVLIAWVMTAIASIFILLLFSWRRRQDPIIYQPRVEACEKRLSRGVKEGEFVPPVPEIPQGFLEWLKPAWRDFLLEIRPLNGDSILKRDKQLMEVLGLDAMTLLQFLRLLRWLFATISILVAGPLIGINYYLNTKTTYGSTTPLNGNSTTTSNDTDPTKDLLDNMQLFTMANITGNGLYVHIFAEWVVSLLVVVFVYTHAQHHVELVRHWTYLNRNEHSFKTIMVHNLDIRPERTYKDGTTQRKTIWQVKQEVCIIVHPDLRPSSSCSVFLTHRDMGKLSELIDKYEERIFPKWDRSLTAWLRRGILGGDGSGYDDCWKRLTGNKTHTVQRLEQAGQALAEIDAAQIEAESEVNEEDRHEIDKTVTSAFITFRSAKEAHTWLNRAKTNTKLKTAGISVQRIWKNLTKDSKTRHTHAVIGKIALVVICFINTIPLMAITLLANINAVIDEIPSLRNLRDSSAIWQGFFTVIGGLLPATIQALASLFLPQVMRFISRWSGALNRGQLDKNVIRQLFVFQIVSSFIVFSLLGVIYESYLVVYDKIGIDSWKDIYDSLGNVPAKIAKAYISESSYWLSWYPFLARTNNEHDLLATPATFEVSIPYGFLVPNSIEYSQVLFAVVVGLVYAPLAPLVVLCGTIFFWAASLVYYNQVMFVEDTKETDGKVWRIVINRLLVSTVLMQLLMVLTISLKTESWRMPLIASIPISFIIGIKRYIGTLKSTSEVIALSGATNADKVARPFRPSMLDWRPPKFAPARPDIAEFWKAMEKWPVLERLMLSDEERRWSLEEKQRKQVEKKQRKAKKKDRRRKKRKEVG
ncbi:hypothetical protein BCR39DRAFT_556933 [Naematelia encephala]|uniref:Uncharacterized protein n=1 Tax=Naematelia encephala TaxID=71784 RepID=A0A1Y2BFW5_9TREE|nr:hypothetical protein BCR39DRAFT_556933 [Naematelia encephala]